MSVKMVSVIVPVYNVEQYLRECVDSILAQTYSDYELILVDDGATDSSGVICDSYAEKYVHIKVVHKENGGLSSARNAGIEVANGKYIAFIDSDDVVHSDYLKEMVALAETEKADLVACDFIKGESCNWKADTERLDIRCGNDILNKMNENDVVVTVAWNKLYNKKFFCEFGLRYPEGKIHEDMFLTPQILHFANKMVITERKLYFYRQRPNSIMSANFSLNQLDILEAIKFRIDFLTKYGTDRLVITEYESFIRKSRQLYLRMKLSNPEVYKVQLKDICSDMVAILKTSKVFKQLSWKYKIKLLLFLVTEK